MKNFSKGERVKITERNHLLFLEYPALVDPVQHAIVAQPLVPTDGWLDVPTGPGLGIEIDDGALERFAVERFSVS